MFDDILGPKISKIIEYIYEIETHSMTITIRVAAVKYITNAGYITTSDEFIDRILVIREIHPVQKEITDIADIDTIIKIVDLLKKK